MPKSYTQPTKARMHERTKQVLLRLTQGMKYEEVAEQLAMDPNLIRNLMDRLRKRHGYRTNMELFFKLGMGDMDPDDLFEVREQYESPTPLAQDLTAVRRPLW